MNETTTTAAALRVGDYVTNGSLPEGTITAIEKHGWTVTVLYTDGREHFTSVLAVLRVERPCVAYIGSNAECGEPALEDREGLAFCPAHIARFDAYTELANKN